MSNRVATQLKEEFASFTWLIVAVMILMLLVEAGLIAAFALVLGPTVRDEWLFPIIIPTLLLLAMGLIIILMLGWMNTRLRKMTAATIQEETHELRTANNRFRSLQAMASTLRATLSFQRAVEAALDVSSMALEEMGVTTDSIVGAVFLYEHDRLVPVATRRFIPPDGTTAIGGQVGVIGEALRGAEPMITTDLPSDPELKALLTFRNCKVGICVPLRAGYQIFGAMLLGSEEDVDIGEDELALFNSVADHAVIALQNAKLYQDLTSEKQRMIEADEEARKELARDLHDGPTQSVAAIAMRLNFIRSLVTRDPEQAIDELEKVERLARETSQEIRGMLFTLRPLVLETEGLAAAIETVIDRIQQTDKLDIRIVGGELGDLLNAHAQSIVFSIVEEALGNARKYANASQIEVRFWREADLFVAQVQDDGQGFDIKRVNERYSRRGSLGMVNMRERAERVDGSLRLQSSPEKGTTMTLVVPLEKHGRPPGPERGGRTPASARN